MAIRYPSYKSTGVSWLGEIPSHWRVDRLKWSAEKPINGVWGAEPEGEDDIACIRVADFDRHSFGVIMEDLTYRSIPLSDRRRRLLKRNDLLIEKSGGGDKQPVGAVVGYEHDIAAVTSNFIAKMSCLPGMHPRYWVYVHAHLYAGRVTFPALKQTTGIQNLDTEAYFSERVAYPPEGEQIAIADYLDRETARIDALIGRKRRLLELLEEKRLAVITHATTKGLDSNAPMKDSSVDWLGQIPAHWVVLQLKRSARITRKSFTDGDWIESPYITDDGIRLIQTGNVGVGEFREQGFRYISDETFQSLSCTEVFPGDILICRLDGPVGRACLAPQLGVRMITSVDNAILKPNKAFDPRFIVYWLSSRSWLEWIGAVCRAGGGFRFRISRTQLGEQALVAPPLAEQAAIADQIDRELSGMTRVVERVEAAIKVLQEYRSALITNAVTGKIDMRGEAEREAAA